MKEFRDINEWIPPDDCAGTAVVLGRFDGVHLGHRSLIDRAVRAEEMFGYLSVCFSFQECTYPGAECRGILTTPDEKAAILEEIGIDILLHPEFTPPLINMSPLMFLEGMLFNRWRAKKIIVGYDFHFGKDREGDADYLVREGGRLGIDIEIISPFMIGGEIVKATRIRELIAGGNVRHASELLGRPYFIYANSIKGRGLGKVIGFPTINFYWPPLKVRPTAGIYAVEIGSDIFDEDGREIKTLQGVANFGFQPTISTETREPVLEVHILDKLPNHILADGIPTGTGFKVSFIDFIRPEEKFGSIEDLKIQIAKDCHSARNIFNSSVTD